MPDQLQTIVQRMLDAGESEDNIGMVISHYKTQSTPQTMSVMEMGRESAASAGAEDAQPSIWSNLKESATIRPTGTPHGEPEPTRALYAADDARCRVSGSGSSAARASCGPAMR